MVDNVSWHEHQQLKEEIARLRGELSRAAVREGELRAEIEGFQELAADSYVAAGEAAASSRALLTPSPLSDAVQEVLEAALEFERTPLAGVAKQHLFGKVHRYRALLEGRTREEGVTP